jgi:diketogulonate reductase-like aldo/keto reductase
MIKRPIPSSGQAIPVVGMGTWQTFDKPATDPAAMAALTEVFSTFHAAGGRVIDSSPMYGRSEAVAGELSTRLKINADLFVATKVWTRGHAEGVRQMEGSLAELRREKIELMQIHNLVDWQAHLKTLRQWKEAGRVRHIGITHYTPSAFDALEQIVRDEPIDFLQLPYSLGTRNAEQRLLPLARDRGVATLINRPFDEGALFRSVRGRALPDPIQAFASSWGEAFLKFILANDAVTCVIPATGNPKHMADNVRAGYGRLPDAKEQKALLGLVV